MDSSTIESRNELGLSNGILEFVEVTKEFCFNPLARLFEDLVLSVESV